MDGLTDRPQKLVKFAEWLSRVRLLILFLAGLIGGTAGTYYGTKASPPDAKEKADKDAKGLGQSMIAEVDYEGIQVCGFEGAVRDRAGHPGRPWPTKKIPWTVTANNVPGLNPNEVRAAFAAAWSDWAGSLDIEPVFVAEESQALVRSRFGIITDTFGRPDGPGNVLAWSELSNGTSTPKHQLYDTAERWAASGVDRTRVLLRNVACHEIGHVLGLDHEEPNSGALMQPTYSSILSSPTSLDIEAAIALGYKRRNTPPPPGPVVPTEIEVKVRATAGDLAEALRKAGYQVVEPKQIAP